MINIDYLAIIIGCCVGLLVGVVGTATGLNSNIHDLKDEACKRGYASWVVVDHRTGHSEFRWNAEPNEKGAK